MGLTDKNNFVDCYSKYGKIGTYEGKRIDALNIDEVKDVKVLDVNDTIESIAENSLWDKDFIGSFEIEAN